MNTFWTILNNEAVITRFKNEGESIMTLDFSTFYIKTPHDKLLQVLHELTNFCFYGGSHKSISV